MKIIVFVKQVPDTVDVKIDPKTGNICRDGVQSTLNPYDANALEAALTIKEQIGATVAAVTMGPPQAQAVLDYALAMGADECYLLSDRAFGGADTLATGYTLAKAAEKIGDYDLLLFGKCSTDAETAQTGPIVAEFLGVPQITYADSINVEGNWVFCKRDLGSYFENVKVKLPAMVAVTENINNPRLPSVKGIMSRSRKPHFTWDASAMECDTTKTGVAGSPSVNKRIFSPELPNTDTVYFNGEPEEIVKSLADMLQEKGLI